MNRRINIGSRTFAMSLQNDLQNLADVDAPVVSIRAAHPRVGERRFEPRGAKRR